MIHHEDYIPREHVITVILLEDEEEARREMAAYWDGQSDMRLAAATGDAQEALALTEQYRPDAVILDLELHLGTGSGLRFLSDLRELSLSPRPFLLVTTHNSSRVTYEAARRLGADYILYKHQTDYSPQSVAELLREILLTVPLSDVREREIPAARVSDGRQTVSESRRKRIYTALDSVGISAKLLGYDYLTEAIEYYAEGHSSRICAAIAQRHRKNADSVERAMQHAINKAWGSADLDTLLENYKAPISSAKGTPTVTEFVAYYAKKLCDSDTDI